MTTKTDMNTEHLTSALAGVAVVSPWWLQIVNHWSEIAAAFLPLLGAVWLVVQIGAKLYEVWKGRAR